VKKLKIKIKRDKDMIRFSGRKHPSIGIWSAVIGILTVLGFVAISSVSGAMNGKGGVILGFLGVLLLALAVFGFYLSCKAFKQRDVFYRFPVIGSVLNGVMIIVFIVVYIYGFGG
jgi:hypothetical protein